MLNQMVKWTVIISLWRKYKQHASVTLIFIAMLFLVNYLHKDFVEFHQQSNTSYLALSYGIKWLAFVVLSLSYYFIIKRINKAAIFDSTLHEMMQNKTNQNKAMPKSNTNSDNSENITDDKFTKVSEAQDPFSNIRHKKTLRSKADFIIDEKEK